MTREAGEPATHQEPVRLATRAAENEMRENAMDGGGFEAIVVETDARWIRGREMSSTIAGRMSECI
eukprot:7610789-Pyramimonas_sp.AAC.1